MMSQDQKKSWLTEYTEFTHIDPVQVSPSTMNSIMKKLFPNAWVVFSKILTLHLAVGFLSLSICNQFGLNPFQTDQSLTQWFMQVSNHHVCMVLCGFFFMSVTYALSCLFLSVEEFEAIRRIEKLQTAILILLSLASFYFFGAEFVAVFTGLWLVGATLGSWLSIEGSYRLKLYLSN